MDVVGWDEMWPLFGPEAIRADLEIGAGGRLLLCNLTRESFNGKVPFIIARVGNWVPEVRADRDLGHTRYVAGCPNSVDVAPGSAFIQLVPFPLTSPADVVTNYERLNALIQSWPEHPVRCQTQIGRVSYWRTSYRQESAE
jgi:hypothetical protein